MQKGLKQEHLYNLYSNAPVFQLSESDKLVVFSDLHMGNGGLRDDFRKNAALFEKALKEYYLPKGYTLILNGDIEELQRFRKRQIKKTYNSLYKIFKQFEEKGRFYKIIGNHDGIIANPAVSGFHGTYYHAVRFRYSCHTLFMFHGHQANLVLERLNGIVGIILKYIANPLGIRNLTYSTDNIKQFKIEQRVYKFSAHHKIVSLIGHTHRPLFESLSKVDSIRYRLEKLIRKYPKANAEKQKLMRKEISLKKSELKGLTKKERRRGKISSIYNSAVVVPCLFNSGCGIAKRGVTGIEINNKKIALVHWFDKKKSRKHLSGNSKKVKHLEETDYYKVVLKDDTLDYVFTRIDLLS